MSIITYANVTNRLHKVTKASPTGGGDALVPYNCWNVPGFMAFPPSLTILSCCGPWLVGRTSWVPYYWNVPGFMAFLPSSPRVFSPAASAGVC